MRGAQMPGLGMSVIDLAGSVCGTAGNPDLHGGSRTHRRSQTSRNDVFPIDQGLRPAACLANAFTGGILPPDQSKERGQ